MAQALGEQGARIFMNARKADEVQQVVAELKARGIEADGIACDLSKPEGNPITTLVDAAEARFGTIDILINNAGTTWVEPAPEQSYAGWQKVMYLNVDAYFLLAQEVARRFMMPRQSVLLMSITSIAVH